MDKLYENREKISDNGRNKMQKEIVSYNALLESYNLTFSDLTNSCPKNATKLKEVKLVAKIISDNDYLATVIKEKKKLPVKELHKLVSVGQITIRTYKKYIIALSLIYIGDFPNIKNYMNL